MLDPATFAALASAAATAITTLLQKAAESGAEEVGKSAATGLLAKLKKRLTHRGATEALDDLANAPADKATQGALDMQLRKALAADPALAMFLEQWSGESRSAAGFSQSAHIDGDHSRITQIVGSGNQVS